MEEYRNRVVNYQPIDPRISANLPVKLARKPHRGGHGGHPPLYEPSRECIPQRGGHGGAMGLGPRAKPQRDVTFSLFVCLTPWEWRDYVAPGACPGMAPRMAPLYLGSVGWSSRLPVFTDLFGLS